MKDQACRLINEHSWEDVLAFGKKQARKLGYQEEDVDRLIHEFREEDRAGKFPDSSLNT